MTPKRASLAYASLAILFVGVFAFQCALSAEALRIIWSAGKHFKPAMLTEWDLELFGHMLAPFAALLLGFYVVRVRIFDGRAWLLLAVLISFAINADGSNKQDAVMLWSTPLKHLALTLRSFALYTFPFWLALFSIYFPAQAGWERRNAKLKWLVLIPVLALCCLMAVLRIIDNETTVPQIQGLRDSAGPYWIGLFYFSVIFFLGLFTVKLLFAKSSDDRRRLRLLLFGMGVTLVPLTLLDLTARLLQISESDLPVWLLAPVFPLILSFPVTLAYVTVVERALDLGVVVREGLQYALARRGVLFLQILTSILVIVLVAAFADDPAFFVRLMITAIGITAVFAVRVGAKHLGGWLDRRFFREAYDTEQILNRLAESVQSIVELPLLLKTVATRIAEALHVSQVAVFLRAQNVYEPVFCLGNLLCESLSFDESSSVVRELTKRHGPMPIHLGDTNSWPTRVSGQEARTLHELRGELLLPLTRQDSLIGFISLGAKKAEAPYSASDMILLQSVASQTSLAVENSRLTAAIATRTAEREVIQRELSIAREVQQRLFPQSYPKIAGLEYCGACRPAREVGGDYYDFVQLPGGSLGIAIGDVAGKGIPASLLMASLQASLRGQTMLAPVGIDLLVENINRLVHAASPDNRYATFFYGVYDASSRRLSYVNGGHNAPMILRKESVCIRLEAGGPPVGLLPAATYVSSEALLETGDLLILFTDGISEAMNSRDEEWGEDRLQQTLGQILEKCPTDIVSEVFEAADKFTGAAPQHDDMTLVVFKID